MRIELLLTFPERTLLRWNYLDWLRGLLYVAMDSGSARIAEIVHEYGFSGGDRPYKLLTFSLLIPDRYRTSREGLTIDGNARWYISSPVEPVIEAVAQGILEEPIVRLGRTNAMVREVSVVPSPPFQETMTFSCLSPIHVSAAIDAENETGRTEHLYLAPDEPDFTRILNENLRRKADALYGESIEGEIRFTWLNEPRSRLFSVNGTQIRGWTMTFRAEGPIPLLQLGYEAGFGSRNTQGFGMVEVKESTGGYQ